MKTADEREADPLRILVADDDQLVLDLLRTMLNMEEYEVVVASDGRQALDRIRTDRPRLVVLDVMMPGMDGITLCRQLKADPELRAIPVVLLTALGSEDDQKRGKDAGADAYLTKPFSPLQLLETMELLLDSEVTR